MSIENPIDERNQQKKEQGLGEGGASPGGGGNSGDNGDSKNIPDWKKRINRLNALESKKDPTLSVDDQKKKKDNLHKAKNDIYKKALGDLKNKSANNSEKTPQSPNSESTGDPAKKQEVSKSNLHPQGDSRQGKGLSDRYSGGKPSDPVAQRNPTSDYTRYLKQKPPNTETPPGKQSKSDLAKRCETPRPNSETQTSNNEGNDTKKV